MSDKMLKEKNILICSNDKTTLEFLERSLREEGYGRVDISMSSEEALGRIAKERYQLVLLDISPPPENDTQILQRIKEIDKNITVIVIADRSQTALAEKAVRSEE